MKLTKILATIGVTALLTGAGLMAAQSASAHDATLTVSQSCNTDGSATITWTLKNDYNETVTVTKTSNPDAVPVGTQVAPARQGKTETNLTQQIPAPAAGTSVSVKINVEWSGDHYTQNDISANITVSDHCVVPPKSDATATATVTPPTCSAPAVLVLQGVNVTWKGTPDGAVGPQSYDSTATAIPGHKFTDGDHSKNFTGELAGPIGYQNTNPNGPCYRAENDAVAAASISQPTCTSAAVLTLTGQNVTWIGTENGAHGPGSYNSTATATAGHLFDNGDSTKNFHGDLAGALGYQNTNPDAPCYKVVDDATATVAVTATTCTVPGAASYTAEHATLTGTLDQKVGDHTATFTADAGHAFADGTTTIQKAYTVNAAPADCVKPPTKPAASVTKPALADTGSDVTVGVIAGIIALLGGAAGVTIAAFRRRGNARA